MVCDSGSSRKSSSSSSSIHVVVVYVVVYAVIYIVVYIVVYVVAYIYVVTDVYICVVFRLPTIVRESIWLVKRECFRLSHQVGYQRSS